MTRSELINKLQEKMPHLKPSEVEAIVLTVFDEISDSLEKGDRVELRGFGAFFVKDRQARKGRNPRTGDSVDVPERKVPAFRSSKTLFEKLN
ncbi:MAG: HU family DNA-binding protein [Alphaproteobacteria bacterium]